MSDTAITVAMLHRASQAIYLAVEPPVADDVSRMLKWSADRIEALEAALATCRELREYDRRRIEALEAALRGIATTENANSGMAVRVMLQVMQSVARAALAPEQDK